MAHLYSHCENRQCVDARLEGFNFDAYDLLLLGGDLTVQTTKKASNLPYLDSIFDISGAKTMWAIGNHDYHHPEFVEAYLNRPLYYARYHQGVTFLVLDSERDQCSIIGPQLNLVKAVTDTIQQSSHLIVLQHKLTWTYNHDVLEAMEPIANGPLGNDIWNTNPNNFNEVVYPLLQQVKEKGIEVLCISGDVGNRVDQFEYRTEDGIWFLAAGFSKFDDAGDKAMILYHQPADDTLYWRFELLDSLVARQ